MEKFAPLLAYCFANKSCAFKMIELHNELKQRVDNKDFSTLDLVHHLSSGFKGVLTKVTFDGLDSIRLNCGGAGFSHWSGLPQLVLDFAPNTTFEGDNTLLLLQASRLIMKNMINITTRGMKASGVFSYLNDAEKLSSSKFAAFTAEQAMDIQVLENALAARAVVEIKKVFMKFASSPASQNEKMNSLYGIALVKAANLHARYLIFKIFREDVESNIKDKKIREIMNILIAMVGLHELKTDSAPLYECGYFSSGSHTVIEDALKIVYVKLRPYMVGLVECFERSDNSLTSAIGNSYGDIYETQLEWARGSRLNNN